jgi:hypothetical protein
MREAVEGVFPKPKPVEEVVVNRRRGWEKPATFAGLVIAAPEDGCSPQFGQHALKMCPGDFWLTRALFIPFSSAMLSG